MLLKYAQFIAAIIALFLVALTTYMIWFHWNHSFHDKIILSFISVYVSIVTGAICGEHIIRILAKKECVKYKKGVWLNIMITNDPVAWVRPIVKTRTRLIYFSLFHIAVICYGLWRVWIYTSLIAYDHDIDFLFYRFFFAGLIPLVIFGIFFPIMYLYALYRIYHKFVVDNVD